MQKTTKTINIIISFFFYSIFTLTITNVFAGKIAYFDCRFVLNKQAQNIIESKFKKELSNYKSNCEIDKNRLMYTILHNKRIQKIYVNALLTEPTTNDIYGKIACCIEFKDKNVQTTDIIDLLYFSNKFEEKTIFLTLI